MGLWKQPQIRSCILVWPPGMGVGTRGLVVLDRDQKKNPRRVMKGSEHWHHLESGQPPMGCSEGS
jgi:hypothetical protein